MARSLLRSLVSGTRQLLWVQLFVALGAVALTGWTLDITTDLVRERNRLRDRIIQLEETMAGRGMIVPAAPARAETQSSANAYPPSLTSPSLAPTEGARAFNPGQVLGDLFAPPPPLRTITLHVRADADTTAAQQIASDLAGANWLRVSVAVMAPRDGRSSGYWYFDGRQSRDAANLVARFNDAARGYDIAPWSAQLRGTALPARGEYGAGRLDLVLPPLPAPAPPPAEVPASGP
jgi:hypothetical protein